MKLKVQVTQKYIDEGSRNDQWWCPVARALRGTLPIERISVNYEAISIAGHGFDVTFPTSRTVKKFINAFDAYGPAKVKPFSFSVRT